MCKRLLYSLLEEPTGTEGRFVHSHLACTVNSHIVPSKIFSSATALSISTSSL